MCCWGQNKKSTEKAVDKTCYSGCPLPEGGGQLAEASASTIAV